MHKVELSDHRKSHRTMTWTMLFCMVYQRNLQRIDYKIILPTFKALNELTAIYIRDFITIKTVSRDLRNNKRIQLTQLTAHG